MNHGPKEKVKLNICVLQSAYEGSDSPMAHYDPPAGVAQYADPERYDVCTIFVHKGRAMAQLKELKHKQFDCYINLCDGSIDENRAGIEVIEALEYLDLPYTGADRKFFEPLKKTQKMIMRYYGVPTARSFFCYDQADLAYAAHLLNYPVIVKHHNGYSSVGMTANSRCLDRAALLDQGKQFIDAYHGVLVEEFIDGREFTVLVIEDEGAPDRVRALAPVECHFPKGESFKHFDLKWRTCDDLMWSKVEEETLANRLKDMAIAMFKGCLGVSYGRCDIRMDQNGSLYMLEINPQCGVFYHPESQWGSADFILGHDPDFDHRRFIDLIVGTALRRFERTKPRVIVHDFGGDKGFGIVAAKPLAKGEPIFVLEEKPQVIVSKAHAKQTWQGKKQEWFNSYCYPISEDVYGMWSDEPEHWRPINHSCEPNAGQMGLDVVALRDIEALEEIKIDYAMFCNEDMADFLCTCASIHCRGVITGKDYLREDLQSRYEGFFSPFITRKIAETKKA